jgi:hypothetical protein
MPQPSPDLTGIEVEIDRIRSLGLDALRERWRTLFGGAAPAGLTKDIMARMIAYRMQEQAFGGLDRQTRKLLDRLARGDRPGTDLNRRIKTGSVLIREYHGERHIVTVVPGAFVWQGASYASLSTIARTITGTAWNGPRFFGLRVASRDEGQSDESRTNPGPNGGTGPRLPARRRSRALAREA